MKKVLFLILTVLLFASCEKKDELSDIVIGNWYSQATSQATVIGSGEDALMVYFTIQFNSNGKYSLNFMDAIEADSPILQVVDYIYRVNDDKSQISIENPIAPRNSGDPIMVTFNVVLGRDDNNSMTWTPEDSEEGTPTLFWTRGTY